MNLCRLLCIFLHRLNSGFAHVIIFCLFVSYRLLIWKAKAWNLSYLVWMLSLCLIFSLEGQRSGLRFCSCGWISRLSTQYVCTGLMRQNNRIRKHKFLVLWEECKAISELEKFLEAVQCLHSLNPHFFSGRKAMAAMCIKFWPFVGDIEGWSGAEFWAKISKGFSGGVREKFSLAPHISPLIKRGTRRMLSDFPNFGRLLTPWCLWQNLWGGSIRFVYQVVGQ